MKVGFMGIAAVMIRTNAGAGGGRRLDRSMPAVLVTAIALALGACAETQLATHLAGVAAGPGGEGRYKVGSPYQINGVWYRPQEDYDYSAVGMASWYGPGFHGRMTANGEIFDQDLMTAAHTTLQMPSVVRVTNLENGRSAVLRLNDRGPFHGDRIIDVSRRAAEVLGFREQGVARVRVEILPEESRLVADAARAGDLMRNGPTGGTGATAVAAAPPAAPAPPVRPAPPAAPPLALAVASAGQPAPVVPAAAVAMDRPSAFFVQAGAFLDYDNAAWLQGHLAGIAPATIATTRQGGAAYHQVRIGPFVSPEDADRALAAIRRAGVPDARIVVSGV